MAFPKNAPSVLRLSVPPAAPTTCTAIDQVTAAGGRARLRVGAQRGLGSPPGESLGVPWYTDLNLLIRETAPEIGIVSVNYHANGEVGLLAIEHGLHVLLETPIAHKLSEADAIIAAAAQRSVKIEVAEQFHRRPLEQIKLKLIETGLFGRVHSSFSDFAGHGYHGVSVMRSYLGFDARPIQVAGAVQQYDLSAHWSRLAEQPARATETQEHSIITFEGGQLGLFHWTDVGYDSALRWWRSSRFLAEKGWASPSAWGWMCTNS